MNTALICVSLLTLLVVGGGFYVSLCRARTNIVCGYPDDPAHQLHKAVRAHGNSVEYVPVIALMIYIIGLQEPPAWVVACMVLVTVARYLIYAGLLVSPTLARPHPLRFMGALFTYIFGLVLGFYLLWTAV